MEKPGQGNSYPRIIDQPELKSTKLHVFEGVSTALLWSVLLYWLYPLITLFLGALGLWIPRRGTATEETLRQLLEVVTKSGIVFLSILFVQAAWIFYNYLAHRKRGKRRKYSVVDPDKSVLNCFTVNAELLKKAKKMNRVEVTIRDDELIIKQ